MNWFVLVNGCCYLGATAYSLVQHNWLWAVVWFAYAVSCFALAILEAA